MGRLGDESGAVQAGLVRSCMPLSRQSLDPVLSLQEWVPLFDMVSKGVSDGGHAVVSILQ